MDTNRIERLGFKPLEADLKRIASKKSAEDMFKLLADFHRARRGACFSASASPDAKNSAMYAFHLQQGGLGMPDRDYYLTDALPSNARRIVMHVDQDAQTMLGEKPADAKAHAERCWNWRRPWPRRASPSGLA